jgi:hypothetical protein
MRKSIAGLSVLFAVAFLGIPATRSYASGTRFFHPTGCSVAFHASPGASDNDHTALANGDSGDPGNFFVPSASQFQNGLTTPIIFYCPLITDPQVTLPAPGLSQPVTVSMFYNGGPNGVSNDNSRPTLTYAKVCRTFGAPGGGTGTQCNVPRLPTGGAQIYELQATVSSGGANDYFYLVVGMGPIAQNLSRNQFFGYRITNN